MSAFPPDASIKEKQVSISQDVHGEKGLVIGGSFRALDKKPLNPSGQVFSPGPPKDTVDVLIIGAGCIGGAIARLLAQYRVTVLVCEKMDDVTQGATKQNSGIVHAGYDDEPGSVRARFCWPGNQMFRGLDEELHFGFTQNGSLVCAKGPEEEKHLQELLVRGKKNGVQRLSIVRGDALRDMEPNLHPDVTAALYSPDAGTVVPYEYAIALMENAVDNGVQLALNTQVVGIEKEGDGFVVSLHESTPKEGKVAVSQPPLWLMIAAIATAVVALVSPDYALKTVLFGAAALFVATYIALWVKSGQVAAPECVTKPSDPTFGETLAAQRASAPPPTTRTVRAKYVVNCAGLFADKVAAMVGDTSFVIKPRIGEYLLLHKNQGARLVRHTLFPVPGPLGKGVLVQTTLWGNLILGPTARNLHDPKHMAQTNDDVMTFILQKCRALVPHFDATQVIHSFAGARAKSSRGDWIIEPCATAPHLIHVAGIDSPGLAGSPAIAEYAVDLLKQAGLELVKNPSFEPVRGPIVAPKNGWKGLKVAETLEKADTMDPACAVICRCEKVTVAEIEDAVTRCLPCDSTQAVRKRTRAGMGHCCGERCEHLVQELIARKLKKPLSSVRRRPWPASSLLPRRWMTDEERLHLKALSTAANEQE